MKTVTVSYTHLDVYKRQVGLLIRHGEVVKKVPETDLLDTLRQELLTWNEQES